MTNKIFTFVLLLITSAVSPLVMNGSAKDTLNTGTDTVSLTLDGKMIKGGWTVDFQNRIDPLRTTAGEIIFSSDTDTLRLTLDEWERRDITIRNQDGKESLVRITRLSDNIYEKPDPELLHRSPSGLLSRRQAQFDINAMVYGLSLVHPDLFSVCRQDEFFKAVNQVMQSLPDSINTVDLFRKVAPVVSMIGDGHTSLHFPFNDLFSAELHRMPLVTTIRSDKSIVCEACIDSIIPAGSRILSINGMSGDRIITSMLPYVSGEQESTKIGMLDGLFPALFEMLYSDESFRIEYLPDSEDKPLTAMLPALKYDDIIHRMPAKRQQNEHKPYSYTVNKEKGVAILDFRTCIYPEKMKLFADSMFSELRSEGIRNLIIDVRENGGGNSQVGDILLQYTSPIPFVQMEKSLVRISPLTRKLTDSGFPLTFSLYETSPENYLQPLTPDEGHYDGNIYLLISNRTFSSGSSFAWTFKECGAGTVIGEETGGMNVSFGDIVYYRLPVSGMYCSISYKRFWQFNAKESEIHGTLPDIEVPDSEALDKALEIIQNGDR